MKKTIGFASVLVLMIVAMAVSVAANPVLSAIGAKSVNEGSTLSFTVLSTAADNPAGSPTAFRICRIISPAVDCIGVAPNANGFSSLAMGATAANITNISNTQAQFNWTPDFTQAGTYTVRFNASDADSSTSENVVITVVDVAPSFSATSLLLGSRNQDRSNPNADNERDLNVNVTGVVTLKNTGGETITNLKFINIVGLSKYSSSFVNANSFAVTLAATTLAPGASTTATVTLRVPENLDAVNSNGEHVAFDVAQLTFSGTKADGVTPLSPITGMVSMMAENNLRFQSARALFDSKSLGIDDGDTIDDVRPGTAIDLEFEVQSRFRDADNLDLEDVLVVAESTGDLDDLDVDEDVDIDTLSPGDVEIITIPFGVELSAARGDEPMIVTLNGIDENGARHGERFDLTINIDRKDHEIAILSAALSPRTVSCEASSDVSVQMRNTGRRDEDRVFLRVFSAELGNFNRNVEIGTLEENDEETRTLTVPVPVNTPAGTYRLAIETYYNVGTKSNTDAVVLTKQACVSEEEPQPPREEPPVVVVPLPPTNQTPVSPAPEAEGSFLDSTGFIALLVLGYVVVLGGGALVLMRLLRK